MSLPPFEMKNKKRDLENNFEKKQQQKNIKMLPPLIPKNIHFALKSSAFCHSKDLDPRNQV